MLGAGGTKSLEMAALSPPPSSVGIREGTRAGKMEQIQELLQQTWMCSHGAGGFHSEHDPASSQPQKQTRTPCPAAPASNQLPRVEWEGCLKLEMHIQFQPL